MDFATSLAPVLTPTRQRVSRITVRLLSMCLFTDEQMGRRPGFRIAAVSPYTDSGYPRGFRLVP